MWWQHHVLEVMENLFAGLSDPKGIYRLVTKWLKGRKVKVVKVKVAIAKPRFKSHKNV